MIKKIRIILSVTFLLLITLLFLNINSSYRDVLSVLARLQFIPSILSFSLGIFIFWLLVTMLFGRTYCSTICPLGTFMDFWGWLSHKRKKNLSNNYTEPKNLFRYIFLGITAAAMLFGISVFPYLIDPYSAYGRIVSAMVKPIYSWIYSTTFAINETVLLPTLSGFIVAAVTFIAISAIAYKKSRIYCNTICPVGNILSIISRHSLWQFEIDPDLCTNCGKCASICKSSCINLKDKTIDMSRCVVCFNCLDSCGNNAIRYTASRKRLSTPLMQKVKEIPQVTSYNIDRRKFFSLTGMIIGNATIAHTIDTGTKLMAKSYGLTPVKRSRAVTPPGVSSRQSFHKNCTACMLCVSNCPAKVLKASTTEYGILNMLQPTMDYKKSYCRYNCIRCTQICPTGALNPLTKAEKRETLIGTAIYIPGNCNVVRHGVECGKCIDNCPSGAIDTIVYKGHRMPAVDVEKCIGCGACEYVCPTPIKAIWVDGNPN